MDLQYLLNSYGKRSRPNRKQFVLQKESIELVFNADIARDFMKTSDQIVKQMAEKSKKLVDVEEMFKPIRNNLMSITQAQFPNSSIDIHFFGSRVIGVATDESDLDIFIEIDGKYSVSSDVKNDLGHDNKFTKLVSAVQANNDWIFQKSILKTAVPIVTCIYSPMNINCKLKLKFFDYFPIISNFFKHR